MNKLEFNLTPDEIRQAVANYLLDQDLISDNCEGMMLLTITDDLGANVVLYENDAGISLLDIMN